MQNALKVIDFYYLIVYFADGRNLETVALQRFQLFYGENFDVLHDCIKLIEKKLCIFLGRPEKPWKGRKNLEDNYVTHGCNKT